MRNCIPAGWATAKLGEVASKIVDGSHNPPPKRQVGKPMLSARNIENDRLNLEAGYRLIADADFAKENARTQLMKGDILLTIVGTIGRSMPIDEGFPEATLQRSVAAIHIPAVLPKFVVYQFQSPAFQAHLASVARGTAQRGVYLGTLSDSKLVLAPAPEQHRIIEVIESYLTRLDAAVASLERIQKNLKRYRASVLKAAVEGRLVPTEAALAREENRGYEPASELLERILAERKTRWIEDAAEKARAKGNANALLEARKQAEKKYKEPAAPPDTTDLPTLPEGWCWTVVENIADVVDPQPSHRTPPVDPSGVPYIGIGDILENGKIDRSRARRVPMSVLEEHRERYQLCAGDFIFGKIGTLGRPVILDSPFDYTLSANVVLVQPSLHLAQRYAFLWMQSPWLMRLAGVSAVATSQPALGIKKIRKLPIPIPPLSEQVRIVEAADALIDMASRITLQMAASKQRGRRLRQSILKWAFEGKLVEQNPNDEPASVLLERIKAERESMQPRKKRRASRQKNEPTKHDGQLDLLGGSNT